MSLMAVISAGMWNHWRQSGWPGLWPQSNDGEFFIGDEVESDEIEVAQLDPPGAANFQELSSMFRYVWQA